MKLVIFDTDRTVREVDAVPVGSLVYVVDHSEAYVADPTAGVDLVEPPPFGFSWGGIWPAERRTYASLATGNHAQPLRPDAGAEAAYRGPPLDRAQQGILLASIHERTGEIADNEAEAKAGTSAVNASFVSALYVVLILVTIITVAAMGPDIVATLGDLY